MEILEKISKLKASDIRNVVDARIREFELAGKGDEDKIFSELCFCILTANSTAENCIRVQKEAGEHFHELERDKLADKLKQVGCRFHTKRAGYIEEARLNRKELVKKIRELESKEIRLWIADNIKGLGMKESSHFLRNIGYKDLAIVDFHIVDILHDNKLIDKNKFKKSLKRADYLEIEKKLEELGKLAKLNLAELDLYLWYLETGKILK